MSKTNKDYYVTVKVVFHKKYVVNAKDWEYAEDYAMDEAWGDTFDPGEDDCITIEPYEVEEL